jgi:hypothetical protein
MKIPTTVDEVAAALAASEDTVARSVAEQRRDVRIDRILRIIEDVSQGRVKNWVDWLSYLEAEGHKAEARCGREFRMAWVILRECGFAEMERKFNKEFETHFGSDFRKNP